jgi:hypothetical protein
MLPGKIEASDSDSTDSDAVSDGPGPAKIVAETESVERVVEEGEATERRRTRMITPDKIRMLLEGDDVPRIRIRFESARTGHKNSQPAAKVKTSRIAIKRIQFKNEQSPRMPLLPLEDIVYE